MHDDLKSNPPIGKIIIFCTIIISNFICLLPAHAQQFRGKVVDTNNRPIASATVVLQKQDSSFIAATTTDNEGVFVFKSIAQSYRLIIQHLAYQTKQIMCTSLCTLPIVMEEKSTALNEVVISSKRPVMKVAESGALVYNINEILKMHPVANALTLLDEIPSVQRNGDEYTIVGANTTTVILNGRKSTLTPEQLREVLANTPASSVKDIEVLYNTPPQYGVRGASINIVIEKKTTDKLQAKGEVHANLFQGYYPYITGGGSLSLSNNTWSWDTSYSLGNVRRHHQSSINTNHIIGDKAYDVSLNMIQHPRNSANRFNSIFFYYFKNKDKLSAFYSGQFDRLNQHMDCDMEVKTLSPLSNGREYRGKKQLHNFTAEYQHHSWITGVDFTFYKRNMDQSLNSTTAGVDSVLSSTIYQKIKSLKFYTNNKTKAGRGFLSYGINAFFTKSDNGYTARWNQSTDDKDNFCYEQKEQSAEVFGGWSQKFGTKYYLNMSMTFQYYYSQLSSEKGKSTLWNDFYVFPNLTFVYTPNSNRTLQVMLSSEKMYPSYWQINPSKTYENFYVAVEGNPTLKPYESYQLNINYIINNKYYIGVYGSMTPRLILQTLYLDPGALFSSYKVFNVDRYNKFGIIGVAPIDWCKYVSTKLSADFYLNQQKGQLEDIAFNRTQFTGTLSMNNNFTLNKQRSLALQVSAYCHLPSIIAFYDQKADFNCSSGLTWAPKKTGWELILKAENIFNTLRYTERSELSNQRYRIRNVPDNRYVCFTVRYNIGGFKEKKPHKINTYRLD